MMTERTIEVGKTYPYKEGKVKVLSKHSDMAYVQDVATKVCEYVLYRDFEKKGKGAS